MRTKGSPARFIPLLERQVAGMTDRDALVEFERRAEIPYAAMYDVRPYSVKECYEDACLYFHRAIEVAQRAGLADDTTRLRCRLEHVEKVYDSQFRGVGR